MDLQTMGGTPVTSENVPSIDNLRAHSPQIPDDNQLQPDTSAIDDPQASLSRLPIAATRRQRHSAADCHRGVRQQTCSHKHHRRVSLGLLTVRTLRLNYMHTLQCVVHTICRM